MLGILLPCEGAPQQAAQPPAQGGLADASLEELMNIEVTSVSKNSQRLSSTAASVFVITAEDIRRSGITVLPELLRLAPGVQVSRLSSGSWAVGIRGFNDEYSNKRLVLVNGRSVYNEFYAGVFWDTLNIPVDNIEPIEVIRGPGAAMWGTNAVNGVINIITKSAKSTQGLTISGGGGSQANSTADVRYGGEAGGASYRLGMQNAETDPFQLVSSASPSRGWINRSGDFRLDWDFLGKDSLQISGGVYQTSLGLMVPDATISSPGAPPADDQIDTSGGNVAARWQHVFSDTSSIEVRFSYDRMLRNDPQGAADINTLDYGFQHHVAVGSRNDIIWGFSVRQDDFRSTPTPALRLNPLSTNRDEVALFGEDEISLIPNKLSFIAGVQVSHMATVGYSVQPTGRLLWTPTKTLSSWMAVSRAERTPSLSDQGIDYYESPVTVPSGVPSIPSLLGIVHFIGYPNERQETVLAYEAGQRVQVSKTISFDISTFYNIYKHLDSVFTGTPVFQVASGVPYLLIPAMTGNDRHGESYGAELAATCAAICASAGGRSRRSSCRSECRTPSKRITWSTNRRALTSSRKFPGISTAKRPGDSDHAPRHDPRDRLRSAGGGSRVACGRRSGVSGQSGVFVQLSEIRRVAGQYARDALGDRCAGA
jgi:iron complex outermembrane receptor protein